MSRAEHRSIDRFFDYQLSKYMSELTHAVVMGIIVMKMDALSRMSNRSS